MNRIEKMKKFYRDNEDSLCLITLAVVSVAGSVVALKAINQQEDTILTLADGLKNSYPSAVQAKTNDDGVLQIKVTQKNGFWSIWNMPPEKK